MKIIQNQKYIKHTREVKESDNYFHVICRIDKRIYNIGWIDNKFKKRKFIKATKKEYGNNIKIDILEYKEYENKNEYMKMKDIIFE